MEAEDSSTKAAEAVARQVVNYSLFAKECQRVVRMLDTLLADPDKHGPHFLPRCKALVLASCFKGGLGLALQHGTGMLLVRTLAGGKALMPSAQENGNHAQSGSYGWSPPIFIRIDGVSGGFTAGLHRSELMIGLLSDAAVSRLLRGGMLALGAEWSICLLGRSSDSSGAYQDLALCSFTNGLMVDVSLSSHALFIDGSKNRQVYGRGTSATELVQGGMLLPATMEPLMQRLRQAEGQVLAEAFEHSHAGSLDDPRVC